MIRPNKIHQDPPLGNDGSHHPGKREPKLQSYHGPHTLAQYHHSENPHQVFKAHMEKDHLYTKKASTRYYALSPVDSDYYSDDDVAVISPVLDVIAVKQVHESKLDPVANVFMGSLTVVGLYVLYRYLHK
jgi:hypothetical protein